MVHMAFRVMHHFHWNTLSNWIWDTFLWGRAAFMKIASSYIYTAYFNVHIVMTPGDFTRPSRDGPHSVVGVIQSGASEQPPGSA